MSDAPDVADRMKRGTLPEDLAGLVDAPATDEEAAAALAAQHARLDETIAQGKEALAALLQRAEAGQLDKQEELARIAREGREAEAVKAKLSAEHGPGRFDWRAWEASRFKPGQAPPERWLVEETIPLAAPSLLAAQGDAGKGMMLLNLALQVASDETLPERERKRWPFGHRIPEDARGSAVYLTAEDNEGAVWRRLDGLDPSGKLRSSGRLFVVPLPNAGGPFAFVEGDPRNGYAMTERWSRFTEELAQLEGDRAVKLVACDPLASFAPVDINADPAAPSFIMGKLAELGVSLGASILLAHHMRKPSKDVTETMSGASARAAIRGSSGLVAGVRASYALWPAEGRQAAALVNALPDLSGDRYGPGNVFVGALVKSNGPADRRPRYYVRNMTTGLLEDWTREVGDLAEERGIDRDASDLLAELQKAPPKKAPPKKHWQTMGRG